MADSVAKLARRLYSLEREVRSLGSTPQLPDSSIDDGSLAVVQDGTTTMVIGEQYDGTATSAVVSGPPPPKPTGIQAVPGFQLVVALWDGTFEDGALAPMDFARMEYHVSSEGPDFVPNVVGGGSLTMRASTESPRQGTISINDLPADVPLWLKVVARSQAGKFSDPSDAVEFITHRLHGTNDIQPGSITSEAVAELALTVNKFKTATHLLY